MQLQEQRNKYKALLNSTKKDYIKNKIENAESPKDLYKICDKLLNREQKAAQFVDMMSSSGFLPLNTSSNQSDCHISYINW